MTADPFGLAAMGDPFPVEPVSGPLDATVALPGSKSITNRALVCAALAQGTSTLRGALLSDDTEAMAGALSGLGLHVQVDGGDPLDPASSSITVTGGDGRFGASTAVLDTRQSGTTSRFLLPMLLLGEGGYEVTCHPQMQARPMDTTFGALRELGAEVTPRASSTSLPALIESPVRRRPAPSEIVVRGDVSSQFLSGLLLSAPCLDGGLRVSVAGPLVSRPYVELTLAVMADFGAEVAEPAPGEFVVAGTGYRSVDLPIEADASAASYPLAAAAICGGTVQVQGLHLGSPQGDVGFARVLGQMGLTVTDTDEDGGSITVEHPGTALSGGTFDFTHISDTAQTLAAVAPFATSEVRIEGIGFIRRKEIDRVAAVATELRRCGVLVDVHDDGWIIHPGPVRPATIETSDDHRMAMSFALLGLRVPGLAIARPACVAKTFPGYWAMLDGLRRSPRDR